jgi:hypothetical protein
MNFMLLTSHSKLQKAYVEKVNSHSAFIMREIIIRPVTRREFKLNSILWSLCTYIRRFLMLCLIYSISGPEFARDVKIFRSRK